jgi:hypothetical protein
MPRRHRAPTSLHDRRRPKPNQTRPQRTPRLQARTTAPLAAWNPALGAEIDISSIPTTLLAGQTIAHGRIGIFANLLERGVLPNITRRPDDSTLSYLERALTSLAAHYAHIPLDVAFFPVHGRTQEVANHVAVSFTVQDCAQVDAVAYAQNLHRLNRALPHTIFERLRDASNCTFEVLTPTTAIELAAMNLFFGDYHEWWEMTREEVADARRYEQRQGRFAHDLEPAPDQNTIDDVSNADIRRYLRDNDVRTPGGIRRAIGAHFDPDKICNGKHAGRRFLPANDVEKLLAQAPKPLARTTRAIVKATATLEAINKRIEQARTRNDRLFADEINGEFPQPAFIIETSPNQLVTELIDEHWNQILQGAGPGPSLWLILDKSTASCTRLERTLDDFATAYQAITTIYDQLNAYSQHAQQSTKGRHRR